MAQQVAVDPNVAVGHDAIKFDEGTLISGGFRQLELLAIPAHAIRKKCAGAAGRIVFTKRPGDAPIMRQRYSLPRRGVEVGVLGAFCIAKEETPIVVKRQDIRAASWYGHAKNDRRQQEKEERIIFHFLPLRRRRLGLGRTCWIGKRSIFHPA